MNYQIRRRFFETSSSSASTFVMVSDKGTRQRVELSEPWICIQGSYITAGDGILHEYLNRWQDKMAFLAEDTPLWHRMFKKATGQDFKLYRLFTRKWEETFNEYYKDKTPAGGWKRLYNIPDGIIVNVKKNDIHNHVNPEYGYIISYNFPFEDPIAVALPYSVPFEKCLNEYNLEECYTSFEALLSLKDIIKKVGEENFDEDVLAEIIFNPGFSINIGGDAFCRDSGVGVINGYLGDEENNSPLKYAGYSALCGSYKNGGEVLLMGFDGTKLRIQKSDILPPGSRAPEYPESIDLKITDQCYNECAFCYENSTPEGLHGEIPEKLFAQIPPFTEIAVGGGNPTLHPDFFELHNKFNLRFNATLHAIDFLCYCRDRYWLNMLLRFDAVGVSVSDKEQSQLIAEYLFEKIDEWCDNIKYDPEKKFENRDLGCWWRDGYINEMQYSASVHGGNYSDLVIHVINGIANEEMLKPLYDKGLKLLILGYKTKGRGVEYKSNPELSENSKWLYDNIEDVARHFDAVAFDTLALEQLNIRRLVSDEDWRHLYMGDDGLHSMYIDLVRGEYGISSTDNRRWKLTDDLKQMFAHVRSVVPAENH